MEGKCPEHKEIVNCLQELKRAISVKEAVDTRRDDSNMDIKNDLNQIKEKLDIIAQNYKHRSEHAEEIKEVKNRIEEVNEQSKSYTIKILGLGLTGAGVLFGLIQIIFMIINGVGS